MKLELSILGDIWDDHAQGNKTSTINLAKVLTHLPSSYHAQNKPLFMQYVCTQLNCGNLIKVQYSIHSYSMQTQQSTDTAQRNQIININNHQNS